jgi:hypothetical protein
MEDQSVTIQKMLMQATLMSNLATLKHYIPEVYDFYQTYQPSGNEIVLDESGQPNILNNGNLVYENAADFAKSQVDLFCKEASMKNYLSFAVDIRKDSKIKFEHERILKKLVVTRRKETFWDEPNNPWEEEKIDFMFMIGAGLGYQIDEIFRRKSICNFFLFEPSPEVFYAMLHNIELKPLIEHCLANAGNFRVTIGFGAETALNNLHTLLLKIGHFNMTRMFIYKHYESEMTEKMIDLLKNIGHRLSQGFGFMEDEIIGLSHALSNIKKNYPLLLKDTHFENCQPDRPVLIVGNGPSLDSKIEIIKERQDEFIIISCGTSLRPLLANDIIPDIHVEMERTTRTLPWIESIPHQEQLKNIQIIALAPVCTDVLTKFKSPKIINKLYDSAGYIVNDIDKKGLFASPDKMNPTVTNCAVTMVISLGFTNIYLIGTDFGFKTLEHHHSKDSTYYDEDKFKADESLAMFTKELSVEGNFGGTVYSTKIFEQSRGNIELILNQNKNVVAHNCSDGVMIKGAKPLVLDLIPSLKFDNKKKIFLSGLLDIAFSNEQLDPLNFESLALNTFKDIKRILDKILSITDKRIQSRNELRLLFSLQYQTLFDELKNCQGSEKAVALFLQGSIKYFQSTIMSNVYYYNDLDKRNNYINISMTIMKDHFYSNYEELLQNYNKPSKV